MDQIRSELWEKSAAVEHSLTSFHSTPASWHMDQFIRDALEIKFLPSNKKENAFSLKKLWKTHKP
jgi:hypothetical protein